MIDGKLYQLPFHENLFLDRSLNIHVYDYTNINHRVYTISDVKFEFNHKLYYVNELIDLYIYGVPNRFAFNDYNIIDDCTIESNCIIFKKIPHIVPGYFISDSGVVYSTHRSMIRRREIDDDGYIRISFSHPNLSHLAIHRLVYTSWVCNIPDGFVIDHKDNNRWNNNVDNLKAVSPFQNTRRAAQDGRFSKSFYWNSDKVSTVCKLMSENKSVRDIAEQFGIFPANKIVYKNFRNQLYNFRIGERSWKDITSTYDFSHYDGNMRSDSKYRDSEISNMRNLYADGMSIQELASIFNHDNRVSQQYFRQLVTGYKRKKLKDVQFK